MAATILHSLCWLIFISINSIRSCLSFTVPTSQFSRPLFIQSIERVAIQCPRKYVPAKINALNDEENTTSSWDSTGRKFLGVLGFIGMIYMGVSTSYLVLFLGIPLSLPASLIYGSIAFLSLYSSNEHQKTPKKAVFNISDTSDTLWNESFRRSLVAVLSTLVATFSLYLTKLLFYDIRTFCPYCLLSAILSYSIFFVTWKSNAVPNKTKAFVLYLSSFLITSFSAFGIYSVTVHQIEQNEMKDFNYNHPPNISKHSDARSIMIAEKLRKNDAAMYGAYWCSHCHNQKEAIGIEAFSMLKYVECSPKGWNNQSNLCTEKKLPGYPTWDIAGKLYPGEKSLDELEQILSETE